MERSSNQKACNNEFGKGCDDEYRLYKKYRYSDIIAVLMNSGETRDLLVTTDTLLAIDSLVAIDNLVVIDNLVAIDSVVAIDNLVKMEILVAMEILVKTDFA